MRRGRIGARAAVADAGRDSCGGQCARYAGGVVTESWRERERERRREGEREEIGDRRKKRRAIMATKRSQIFFFMKHSLIFALEVQKQSGLRYLPSRFQGMLWKTRVAQRPQFSRLLVLSLSYHPTIASPSLSQCTLMAFRRRCAHSWRRRRRRFPIARATVCARWFAANPSCMA